jgi:WD40 repeat protein
MSGLKLGNLSFANIYKEQIMLTQRIKKRFFSLLSAFSLVLYSSITSASLFELGDVFGSTSDGKVHVYSQFGTLKQVLDTGLGGYTTGSTFDSDGNFYVTAFSSNVVSQFDMNGNLIDATWATGLGSNESIVFDAAGNAYIGNASAPVIKKVDENGDSLVNYQALQNTDWIDLAADQETILYSNEGSTIRELNTTTLVDTVFTTGSYSQLFAKRYLSDNGVIAASSDGNAYRWDEFGVLQQTYNVGIGSIFALNLDPDGTSFWTGTLGGQNVRKVNITTGAIEQSWSTGIGQLYGLSVFGEIQAGGGGVTPPPPPPSVPEPMPLTLFLLGMSCLVVTRYKKSQ